MRVNVRERLLSSVLMKHGPIEGRSHCSFDDPCNASSVLMKHGRVRDGVCAEGWIG